MNENESFWHNLFKILPIKTCSCPFPKTVLFLLLKFSQFKLINCFLEDAELQSRKLIHIFKLPLPIINNQQIFVLVYIVTDFRFFMATSNMPFQLLSFERDHCLLRWKQLINCFLEEDWKSSTICSIFNFEPMNMKALLDVLTQYRNLLYP